jgi:hypothetical protein
VQPGSCKWISLFSLLFIVIVVNRGSADYFVNSGRSTG